MDRAFKLVGVRHWVGLSLALTVGLVDLGCAGLPWRKPSGEPPMLGRATDTSDIYAMGHKSNPPNPAGSRTAAAPAFVVGPNAGEEPAIEEVGLAVRPSQTVTDPMGGGVALQPPTSLDVRPSPRAAHPADGVPNAGLVLASAERRVAPASAFSPETVVAEARAALDAMATYEVSLHRQERVNGALLPEEDVVVAIRREPKAVRLSWTEGPNQGREVLYRSDEPNAPMHVKMANPALPRLTLPPESPLVMKNSRHPVTEAGLDSIVEGLENAVKASRASGIVYAGLEAAEGLNQPHHCLTRRSPSGDLWRIYLDPTTHLPSLVLATDAQGELLERYLFHDVRPNPAELTTAEAFDADARWGQARGLFGRLARGASSDPATPPQ